MRGGQAQAPSPPPPSSQPRAAPSSKHLGHEGTTTIAVHRTAPRRAHASRGPYERPARGEPCFILEVRPTGRRAVERFIVLGSSQGHRPRPPRRNVMFSGGAGMKGQRRRPVSTRSAAADRAEGGRPARDPALAGAGEASAGLDPPALGRRGSSGGASTTPSQPDGPRRGLPPLHDVSRSTPPRDRRHKS